MEELSNVPRAKEKPVSIFGYDFFILLFLGALVGLGVSLPYDGLSGSKTIAIDYPRSLGTP